MDEMIQRLQERLAKPLPGKEAHNLMKPRMINGQSLEFKYQEKPKSGAVLIAFYKEKGQVYFPLIQRPPYDGVHGGQIGLPGGRWEEEDSDLTYTALREAEEEVGLKRETVTVIGSLSQFYVAASNFNILPVIGYVEKKPSFVPDHIEVEEVIEAPLNHLTDQAFHKEKTMDVRGFPLVTPYFEVNQKVVWGATAMMLSELYTILKEL